MTTSFVAEHLATVEGLKVRVAGMEAANAERAHRGEAVAYNERDFENVACQMFSIANVLHEYRLNGGQ